MENPRIIAMFVVVSAIMCCCRAEVIEILKRRMIQCSYPGNIYKPDDPVTGLYLARFATYTSRERDCCVIENVDKCCITTTADYGVECRCQAGLVCAPLAPKSHCNAATARVLNSRVPYDSCKDFPGVFRLAFVAPTGVKVASLCNGLLASVNTVWKLITTQTCVTVIEQGLAQKMNMVVQVSRNLGDISLSNFKLENGAKGIGYISFDQFAATKLYNVCRRIGCIQSAAMAANINTGNCQVLSYGAVESTRFYQDGLRQIAVKRAYDCPDMATNTDNQCFTTKDAKKSLCSGDVGAPVFCMTMDTYEYVVVGFVAGNWNSCGDSASFWIVPYTN